MNRAKSSLLAVALLAAAVGVVFVWRNRERAPHGAPSSGSARTESPTNEPGGISALRGAAGMERLRGGLERLRRGATADEAKRTLEELKAKSGSLPREETAAAAREFLKSGADASTGLSFKPGSGGALAEAPSLRVFVLDELARLDPAAAVALAREILREKTSPDEWAVALRNVARVETGAEGRAFLEGRMRELLTHEPWQREASAGYLEAFDVAVHLRGTNLVRELAALVRLTDNRAVSHAAYLALDRLTLADPAALLAKLADEPDLMAGRELTRANYLARADVSDAAQRAVLMRYLLDPSRTGEELRTFAGVYPNANFMISENLLTTVNTPDRAALMARDQAALRVLNEWLADARFAPVRPTLELMRARLDKFARQAEAR